MFAPADTFMTPKSVIPTAESRPEQNSKIFLMTGFARYAESRKICLKKQSKKDCAAA